MECVLIIIVMLLILGGFVHWANKAEKEQSAVVKINPILAPPSITKPKNCVGDDGELEFPADDYITHFSFQGSHTTVTSDILLKPGHYTIAYNIIGSKIDISLSDVDNPESKAKSILFYEIGSGVKTFNVIKEARYVFKVLVHGESSQWRIECKLI